MSRFVTPQTTAQNSDGHDQSQHPMSAVMRPSNSRKSIDTHELLKRELYAQANLPLQLGGLVPESAGASEFLQSKKYGVVDRFFYLDSSARSTSSDLSIGQIAYDLQTLNQNKPLNNIIEMEINDFYLPEIPKSTSFPAYFFFRRLMISIIEMEAQAIFAENSTFRFHFELDLNSAGISNYATNIGHSKFIFTIPFRDISNITLRFNAPTYRGFKNIAFAQDIFQFSAIPLAVGGVFGGATIATNVPHGLTVGDDVTIFITDFFSGIPSIDNNIGTPAYTDGHLVRVISTTVLEFRALATVGFNFTTLLTATTGSLLVGFRRIAFVLRFRSITPEDTNQIVPV